MLTDIFVPFGNWVEFLECKKAKDLFINLLSVFTVVTKRGDLEVLAFNMIHWLCSTLPWEQVIELDKKGKDKTVEEMKIKFMNNISEGLTSLKFPPTEKG